MNKAQAQLKQFRWRMITENGYVDVKEVLL